MREFEMRGVEEVPLQPRDRLLRWMLDFTRARQRHNRPWPTVQRISNNRMPQRLHMNTDLVGSPGLDPNLDQCERAIPRRQPLQPLAVRHGAASVWAARR